MLENKGAIESIKQSKAYVSGRWLDVFWRLLIIIIILIVVSMLVSLIGSTSSMVGTILNLVFSILVTPFFVCYLYILYRGLRENANTAQPINAPSNNSPMA